LVCPGPNSDRLRRAQAAEISDWAIHDRSNFSPDDTPGTTIQSNADGGAFIPDDVISQPTDKP